MAPHPQPLFSIGYRFLLGSKIPCYITFYITPCVFLHFSDALLDELCKFRGFAAGQTKHKKYRGHYEVSTNDFPINFSSIFNWL